MELGELMRREILAIQKKGKRYKKWTPSSSFSVKYSLPCNVMNAQICLQVPFNWNDLKQLKFWSQATRQAVRRRLILHAVFCGISNFLLWDLLPAVHLSFPELLNDHRVSITSPVEDLEDGTLLVAKAPEGEGGVNMPALIKDINRFMEILFESWRKTPVQYSSSDGC